MDLMFQAESYFNLLFSQRFAQSRVKIYWQPSERRLPEGLQREIDDYWQAEVIETCKASYLFNWHLCRLNDWSIDENTLRLSLGNTSYKELLFSNTHIEYVEEHFGSDYFSRALGVSVILVSSDERILLIRRSESVGESPGRLDVLGGHVHPDDHAVVGIPDPFFAMRDELLEEIKLNLTKEEPLSCIGLVEITDTKKPELIFHVMSGLSSEEIVRTGSENRSAEISELFAIANARNDITSFLNSNHRQLSHSAIGALWIYLTQWTS